MFVLKQDVIAIIISRVPYMRESYMHAFVVTCAIEQRAVQIKVFIKRKKKAN